ncbi:MAG: hypothetical protein ACK551_02830 [Vampirovibrionales bacterium]
MIRSLIQSPLPLHKHTLPRASYSPEVLNQQRQGLELGEGVEMILNRRFNLYATGHTPDLKDRFGTALSQIQGLRKPSLSLNIVNDGLTTLCLSKNDYSWNLYMWRHGKSLAAFVECVELLATKLAQFQDDSSPNPNTLAFLRHLQELEHALMRLNRPEMLPHDYQPFFDF